MNPRSSRSAIARTIRQPLPWRGASARSGGMAYAADSKSAARKGMRVRLPPPGPRPSTRGSTVSSGRQIDYPTNRLLAVIDDPAEAAAALAELRTGGIATKDLE